MLDCVVGMSMALVNSYVLKLRGTFIAVTVLLMRSRVGFVTELSRVQSGGVDTVPGWTLKPTLGFF